MDSKDITNLKNEAQFQDTKIDRNVRASQGKYYCDRAAIEAIEFRKNLIGDLNGKKVLDIGCGAGGTSVSALKSGAIVTAIDISPASIKYLINCAEEMNLSDRLTACVMDAQNLDFPDNTFDIVIGAGILHHLPHFEKALKEIRRVLVDDGYAVFHEPLGMNPLMNLYRKATPDKRTKDEAPFKMKELNTIKDIFPNTEFAFFETTTLFSKIFLLLHLNKLAKTVQKPLLNLDKKLLSGYDGKFTFAKKMAWAVVFKMKK